MIRHLRIIKSIVWKDLLSLWPVMLATTALVIAWAIFDARKPPGQIWAMLSTLLQFIAMFGLAVVVTLTVQQDPAMGPRHDWRTRPVPRIDLVIAKYLVAALALMTPLLISRVIHLAHMGAPPAEIAAQLLSGQGLLIFLPLAIAFAATAETLLGSMVMVAITLVAGIAGGWVFRDGITTAFGGALFDPLTSWIASGVFALAALVVAIAVLWLAFTRHRVWLSRAAFLLGVFVAVTITAYAAPRSAVWAAAMADAPDNARSRDITGAFENTCLSADTKGVSKSYIEALAGDDAPGAAVGQYTVRFKGLLPNQRLIVEDDSTHAAGSNHGLRTMNTTGPLRRIAPAEAITSARFGAAGEMLEQARAGALKIDTRFDLTLLEETQSFEFPLDGKRHKVPGFGWCSAGATMGQQSLNCFKPGEQPDFVALTVKGRSAACAGCAPDYKPSWLERIGGRTYNGQARYTASDTGLVTTYRVVSHFERNLRSPAISLTPASCVPPTDPFRRDTVMVIGG